MKKLILIMIVIMALFSLAACGDDDPALLSASEELLLNDYLQSVTSEEYLYAELDKSAVEIKNAFISPDEYTPTTDILSVLYEYTNNDNINKCAVGSLEVKAYQNGNELDMQNSPSELPDGWEKGIDNYWEDISPGATTECVNCFVLEDTSDVTIEITEYTGFTETSGAAATATYIINE